MIATCSIAPPPFPPLVMSSSSDSGRWGSHDRPVLPPIRDLFRELSSSRVPPESPSLTLARLRVSDEEDSRQVYASQSRPSSTRPPSRANADPVYPQPSRFNTTLSSRPSSHDPRGPRGPYPMPDFQNAPPRTMSYDRAAYPPSTSYPVHRNSVPAYDPRVPRPPFEPHPAVMSQPPSQPAPPYYTRTQPPSNVIMPPVISTGIYGHRRGEDDDRTPVARYQPSGLAGFAPPDASASGPSKYECTYCGKGFSRPSSLKIHLNSHTGEKPFVCPVDGCGRSFSVLSNMRRHARVHTTPMMRDGDDGTAGASPLAGSSYPDNATAFSGKWKHRRNSSASASSSSSRRSHSVSSDEEEDYDRPDKRTRHYHK
ncbi:hypothetical protein DFH08DRAFT_869399 [Mycena albidolilacea]|uniref:C2H2-type domain-containing protein n=1 Tax=Mycena albidolilacea TaxID=1033008 RepID=A0AAD7EQW3_9AGAR|nr:hypothetical protein DFH08DRAFT_869399 [Mycena albidolilacea]